MKSLWCASDEYTIVKSLLLILHDKVRQKKQNGGVLCITCHRGLATVRAAGPINLLAVALMASSPQTTYMASL